MGNNQAYGLHHQVVETLKTETKFSEGEISDLYRQFRLDAKALTMNSAHFTEMYRSVYPHGQPENLAERVFATFDQRKDGKVDFHEFLSALNVQLKGTIKMKYEWVFDVIDHKTRGNVEGENIREVIKVSWHDIHWISKKCTHQILCIKGGMKSCWKIIWMS